MADNRRVVVTGLGVISALGLEVGKFWANLLSGKSGISRIDRFDVEKIGSKIGGFMQQYLFGIHIFGASGRTRTSTRTFTGRVEQGGAQTGGAHGCGRHRLGMPYIGGGQGTGTFT